MKFAFYTQGCKVNQCETQALEKLAAAGVTNWSAAMQTRACSTPAPSPRRATGKICAPCTASGGRTPAPSWRYAAVSASSTPRSWTGWRTSSAARSTAPRSSNCVSGRMLQAGLPLARWRRSRRGRHLNACRPAPCASAPGLSQNPGWVRSILHLLHHSLRPGAQPLPPAAAGCRAGGQPGPAGHAGNYFDRD